LRCRDHGPSNPLLPGVPASSEAAEVGAWPAIFAVLALYGFLAALAPAGWNEPLVLLGIGFAALSGYAWLDPARRMPSTRIPSTSVSSTSEAQASRGRKWFG
jgi:hypothetical protein